MNCFRGLSGSMTFIRTDRGDYACKRKHPGRARGDTWPWPRVLYYAPILQTCALVCTSHHQLTRLSRPAAAGCACRGAAPWPLAPACSATTQPPPAMQTAGGSAAACAGPARDTGATSHVSDGCGVWVWQSGHQHEFLRHLCLEA